MEIDRDKYLAGLEKKEGSPRVDYEFQTLGLELQGLFGKEEKGIWPLFHEKGMSEDRVRRAIKEFKKRRFGYFRWILKEIIKN